MIEFGEALKQMADVKYSLDDNIKQSFLEPLHHLQTKDLKEVMVSEMLKARLLIRIDFMLHVVTSEAWWLVVQLRQLRGGFFFE